ncbi:MAG TPA: hypothetical protein VK765_01720 [Solirubrobacteraceae bacterium]|jgi:hypothetical protein|nr:hypothetical protein [Solirubrobacteraceae bacterium]
MTDTRRDTGYERLLEDFGQVLGQAETRTAGSQRGRRRAGAGALGLAGIATGALLLTGAGSSGRLDVVAQARAALEPSGQVVHLVTTSHMEMRGGSQAGIVGPEAEENTPRIAERWSASQPTRWRLAATVPFVTAQGTTHPDQMQLAYAGGVEELYLKSLNTLQMTTGVSEDSTRASLRDDPLGTDPGALIRSMLEAGQLHNDGSGTVDGHVVERLIGDEPGSSSTPAHPPWPVEYDVDASTYIPVRLTVEEVGVSFPGNTGTPTQVVEVNAYEQLPLNQTTATLLGIHPAGNPTVTHHHR